MVHEPKPPHVDVLLLTSDPRRSLSDHRGVSDFGAAARVAMEDHGKVTSVRALYDDGLEGEFVIAPPDWGSTPLDPGTAAVARGGIVVLLERDGEATALARACSPSRSP